MGLYLLFLTDAWHTHTSKELIGVFTTREKSFDAAKRHCRKHNRKNPLRDDDMRMLDEKHQTQNREQNYMVEAIPADTLL